MPLFRNISGKDGDIRIRSIGVLVGTFKSWTLTRRPDDGPGAGLYDLFAVFSYFNPHMWEEEDYAKVITVRLGKDEFHVIQDHESFGAAVDTRRSIRIEGVSLENA